MTWKIIYYLICFIDENKLMNQGFIRLFRCIYNVWLTYEVVWYTCRWKSEYN